MNRNKLLAITKLLDNKIKIALLIVLTPLTLVGTTIFDLFPDYKAFAGLDADTAHLIAQRILKNYPLAPNPKTIATNKSIACLSFNNDGSLLASGSGDGSITIVDTKTWQPLQTLKNHTNTVLSVNFNNDGSFLASGSGDSSIIIWDTKTWQPVQTLKNHAGSVYPVTFSNDGSLLASGGSGPIIIWDTKTWQPIQTLKNHTNMVLSVNFNNDGSLLASGSWDYSIIIWDTTTWQPIQTLNNHTDMVTSVAFNNTGSLLASGSRDKSVVIWDTQTWQPIQTLNNHTDMVYSVAFNNDGSRLASGDYDRSIIIWDTKTWKPVTTLNGHTGAVRSVVFNNDGSLLASGSEDNSIIIWELKPLSEHDAVWLSLEQALFLVMLDTLYQTSTTTQKEVSWKMIPKKLPLTEFMRLFKSFDDETQAKIQQGYNIIFPEINPVRHAAVKSVLGRIIEQAHTFSKSELELAQKAVTSFEENLKVFEEKNDLDRLLENAKQKIRHALGNDEVAGPAGVDNE